jgi:hypothetical protein
LIRAPRLASHYYHTEIQTHSYDLCKATLRISNSCIRGTKYPLLARYAVGPHAPQRQQPRRRRSTQRVGPLPLQMLKIPTRIHRSQPPPTRFDSLAAKTTMCRASLMQRNPQECSGPLPAAATRRRGAARRRPGRAHPSKLGQNKNSKHDALPF